MARPNAPPPSATPVVWQLRLIGRPALIGPLARQSIELRPKDAALLAAVALAGPIQATHLAAWLWPDAGARQADNSLRQRLFRLRHATGAALVTTPPLLSLAPDVETDLAGALGRIADDDQAGREELMGDLQFDGLAELGAWLGQARHDWHERRDETVAAAAAACERAGELARARAYAQRLVDARPLAEHAWRRLMRLHYLRGDRAAAIAAFEDLERRLKDELGTRPSAETVELLATIERSGAQLPARRRLAPVSLIRPPRLVGRTQAWQALEQSWAAGRVFLLAGEAGIGKSRLLIDFCGHSPGALAVQARPGDAGVPFAVMARLLRALLAARPLALAPAQVPVLALLLPELGEATSIAGSARRLAMVKALEATLVDAHAAGLSALLIDDLHFADDASIDLLQPLLESPALGTLRWGLALRPADAGRAAGLLQSALLETRRLDRCLLAPLDLTQLAELIESLGLPELDPARLAPPLLRHSGGNPLFALETLRDLVVGGTALQAGSLALPQPASVGALIERRLGQLSAPALKLARVAALAGPDFSAELAAAVLDLHPLDIAEPWRELEAAQVIRHDAFAHDLILAATSAGVPEPIARLLHAEIAQHLADRGSPPAVTAPHWAGAAQWPRAGTAYVAAARAAQAASQRTHEVEHWEQAARAFDRAGDRAAAFQARCDSVQALIVVQGVAPARTLVDSLVAQAQSGHERASALLAQAMAALMAADHRTGIAAAQQAALLASQLGAPALALDAACLQSVGLAQAGRAAEGLALIEPLRDWVEREGTPQQCARFWSDYAYALNAVRRLRDTAHALQRAIGNAQALGDLAELATLTSNMATVQGNLGHVDEALVLARRAWALQTQLGATDGPEGGVVHAYVGLYCGMVGRYQEALEHLDSALACFARDGQALWTAVASNHKVQVLLDLGQFARARQAMAYDTPTVTSVRVRGLTLAARIDRATGVAAQGTLDTALAMLGSGDDTHVRMHLMLDIALDTDPPRAEQLCQEVHRLACGLEFAGVALKARLREAQLQLRAGDVQRAADTAREAVASMERIQPADLYLAEAWWIAAQVFSANGDGDDALLALARGAQWVRRIALPQVPEAFRDSFLQRNAVNRALLAAADRRLLQQ